MEETIAAVKMHDSQLNLRFRKDMEEEKQSSKFCPGEITILAAA